MKRRTFVAGVAGTAGLALSAAACSSSTTTSGASSAPAAAVKGGTLNILMSTKVEHWDPQRVYVGVDIEAGNRLFTRTLTTWTATTSDTEVPKLVGDMATDTGTVSDGGKTWKFTLKDGLKWQDGSAVTADDVKYGISRTFAVDVITGGPTTRSPSSTSRATPTAPRPTRARMRRPVRTCTTRP